MERTSEEKVLSGLAHVAVLFSWVGLVFNIVVLLIYVGKSQYIRAHVKQALGLQAIWLVFRYAVGITLGIGAMSFLSHSSVVYTDLLGRVLIGGLLFGALGILLLVLVIIAAVKGFQGQEHRYPIFGDFVAGIGE